jgi:branched-chain amino acid transport system permease protein
MNATTRTLLPLVYILAAAAWLGLPFVGSAVLNDWQFRASTLIMLATSWNMMANAGLISLGHSAFWGVGSYAAILAASRLGLPLLPALCVAIGAGAVLGLIIGAVTGSLRGIFFAIATLALAEGLRATAFMTNGLTGGAVGLFLPQGHRPTRLMLETTAAGAAIAAVLVALLLVRSRYHYAFRAMRSNESACQMLGVDPRRFRIGIVTLSGAVASCAGGLNAWYGGFLDPDTAFTLTFTIQAQIATILGGIHFVAGPVIGSILIVGLADATRILLGDVPGASQLAYGIILVLAVLFMSGGLCGAVVRRLRTKPAKTGPQVAGALP